jgi:hypothetical protein
MLDVMAARRLALASPSVVWAELQHPSADRLIGDEDTPLEQHLLKQPDAQRKAKYNQTAWAMF